VREYADDQKHKIFGLVESDFVTLVVTMIVTVGPAFPNIYSLIQGKYF